MNKLGGIFALNIAHEFGKQSRHMELSDKILNIDKLRGKQLRKIVKKEVLHNVILGP